MSLEDNRRCWRRLGVWELVGFEMAFESLQGMTRSNELTYCVCHNITVTTQHDWL